MKKQFKDVQTITHQGIVVAFARVATEIYFNVLELEVGSTSDELDWTGFDRVKFPPGQSPAGMSIINVGENNSAMPQVADVPFRVVSDQKYITIFRQSAGGTLLSNKFMLKKGGASAKAGDAEYVLEPAWQVRFTHSGKKDIPENVKDNQNYFAPGGEPFLEPTIELSMVKNLVDGRFTVLLLPSQVTDGLCWQIFAYNNASQKMDLFSFPMDENGLFDLTGKKLDENHEIPPDYSFILYEQVEAGEQTLGFLFQPSATFYVKQQRVKDDSGESLLIKRNGRVMLSTAAQGSDGKVKTAIVDFAVSSEGTLAEIEERVLVPEIPPANYTLDFDDFAYLTLDNNNGSLSITDSFTIEAWIYPKNNTSESQLIIGGAGEAPEQSAPYILLKGGTKIEAGFGDGSEAITCVTAGHVIEADVWQKVTVSYDVEAAKDNFEIKINDEKVPVGGGKKSRPGGTAISRISAEQDGFVGRIDSVIINVKGQLAAHWAFDSVDYNAAPPVTPDSSPNQNNAYLYGPRLVLSQCPIYTESSGKLYMDKNGLTIYAGYLDFVDPLSSPYLLDGSDGLIHLYFQGPDNGFDVAQYDVESNRAVYNAPWKAEIKNKPDRTQNGFIEFVAIRPGTMMNAIDIAISDSSGEDLCDLTIGVKQNSEAAWKNFSQHTDASIATENWQGVPRRMDEFVAVFNGSAVNDPSDPLLKTGKKVFFDYEGQYPICRLPVADPELAKFVLFITRFADQVPLHSIEVKDKTGKTCQAVLQFNPLKWNKSNDIYITQNWDNLPVKVKEFIDTLNGVSSKYDYSATGYSNSAVYPIRAGSPEVDEQSHQVLFFTHPDTTGFSIAVEDAASGNKNYCKVVIDLATTAKQLKATWDNVCREQNVFARVIGGEGGSEYDYTQNASGDYEEIGKLLIIITDKLSAGVANHQASETKEAGMLAGASIFEVFLAGPHSPTDEIDNHAPIPAAILQQAYTEEGGEKHYLTAGSNFFGTRAASRPTNGAVPVVQDTTPFTDGTANLIQPGINGGWLQESPRKAVEFNADNYIDFDVTRASANRLAIAGDISVEGWYRSTTLSPEPTNPRLFTFNKEGNVDFPDEQFQYMAGFQDSPCLNFRDRTSLNKSYRIPDKDCSVQIWINPLDIGSAAAICSLNYFGGEAKDYLNVHVTNMGKVEVTYGNDLGSISSTKTLKVNKWTCISATVKKVDEEHIDLRLYINGTIQGSPVNLPIDTQEGNLATFTLGSIYGESCQMRANGACFWEIALDDEGVQGSYNRTIPDDDYGLVIKWLLIEGEGDVIKNSAKTGSDYNTTVQNLAEPPWYANGIYYKPFSGHKDNVLAAKDTAIFKKDWVQLASVYRSGYALNFTGVDYVDCGNNGSLDLNQEFSLEAWITPVKLSNTRQILVSKTDSYEIGIGVNNTVYLTVFTSKGEMTLTANKPLSREIPCYIAAVFLSKQKEQKYEGGEKPYEPLFLVHAALYIDGQESASFKKEDYKEAVTVVRTKTNLNFARNSREQGYYTGYLSDVRLWNRVLSPDEIKQVYQFHSLPANQDGLISYWRFSEMKGKMAFDASDLNNGKINSNELWSLYEATSFYSLYVNGRKIDTVEPITPEAVGGYGCQQFVIGGMKDASGSFVNGFIGQIDEVRIWKTELTAEQVGDNLYRPLSGSENKLAGYWRCDNGSGTKIEDQTGRGNNGVFSGDPLPGWVTSTAPLNNEAKEVFNVLGGVKTYFLDRISAPPSVVEYADTQRDAYGDIFSVMKRCYGFLKFGKYGTAESGLRLVTGYKVGDLDTVYAGQVQTKPTIIGYIEGAPPIPSENQTMPFWAGDISERFIYAEGTSVQLNESDETVRIFTGSKQTGSVSSADGQFGIFISTDVGVDIGLGCEASATVFVAEGHVGFKMVTEDSSKNSNEKNFSVGQSRAITNKLTPGGEWEAEDNILNPDVGRRFIADNIGYALVKSLTADLYMVKLKGRNTLVKFSIVPNLDIPEDMNIIDFPIDPRYIKNGTLDGKIGLKNDPDYPNADSKRGSYFKPLEAYSLKRRIEREEKQMEAYFQQFDTSGLSGMKGYEKFEEEKLPANPAYDWQKRLSKRNIVNTYVWTAGGGMFTEQHSLMDAYTESYSGFSASSFSLGLHLDTALAAFVGVYGEFEALWGNNVEVTSVKSKESSSSFSLESEVKPDWFLKRPIVTGDDVSYSRDPAPGKVDGYRFMSFYLAPTQDHYDTFFNTVVDKNWLNNSMQANAVALREAGSSANGVWRVLHRVTYVSRIPPEFQPVPDETQEPDITPPANMAANTVIIRLVETEVGKVENPSAVEIGNAIRMVLGEDASSPGILGGILPWWKDFLTKAGIFGSTAYKTLLALREDLLNYMIQKYETEQFGK
jgi:hypothetical protein